MLSLTGLPKTYSGVRTSFRLVIPNLSQFLKICYILALLVSCCATIREGQDASWRWYYPSQKFRRFLKNIPDSRKRFLLGIELGGDVKFWAPSGPIRPHFLLFSSILINAEKLGLTGPPGPKIVHPHLTLYPVKTSFCYQEYFLKIS